MNTVDEIRQRVLQTLSSHGDSGRCGVTLAWAQSLNGAIARKRGERTILSGDQSLVLTHILRSLHRGLLVGLGTVMADDPLLNVRLVEGPSPIPIILDTYLRTPPSARLFERTDSSPWIFYGHEAEDRRWDLEVAGAKLIQVPTSDQGLDLRSVLTEIKKGGIDSVMVEGGATVLASFLAEDLADQAVITLCPRFMDGLGVLDGCSDIFLTYELSQMWSGAVGPDLAIWGVP